MKKTIKDIDLNNKKIILRCDLNVPIKDNAILDDTRIVAAIDTIDYLIEHSCKIVIMSHLGKVKTVKDKESNSLEIVAKRLSELLKKEVIFSKETRGMLLEDKINKMNCGDVLLIENTRFEDVPNNLESGCDEQLAEYWSGLGEIFVNDAFGAIHRCHASNYGISKYLPSVIGFLVEKELKYLNTLIINPPRPYTVIMGGAKIEDKIPLIKSIINKCDYLLVAGGVANTFLKALKFNVGFSIYDSNTIPLVSKIMLENKEKIMLPLDVVVGNKYNNNYAEVKSLTEISDNDAIYDIGPKTIEKYKKAINNSQTIFINGTMGKYEDPKFCFGTKEICQLLVKSPAKVIGGGGDILSAINKFDFAKHFYYLSTGGGATLEYLTNPNLKCLENIEEIQ